MYGKNKKGWILSENKYFFGVNVHKSFILAKSSSDEMDFDNPVFMRVASKFV